MPAITLFCVIEVIAISFAMLALSSLSKSRRFVAVMYAGAVLFAAAMYRVLRGLTGRTAWAWISPEDVFDCAVDRHLPLLLNVRRSPRRRRCRDCRDRRSLHRHPRPAGTGGGRGHVTSHSSARWCGRRRRAPFEVVRRSVGAERRQRRDTPWRDRPARSQRRRQVDVHEAGDRTARAQLRDHPGAGRADLGKSRRCTRASDTAPTRRSSTKG